MEVGLERVGETAREHMGLSFGVSSSGYVPGE